MPAAKVLADADVLACLSLGCMLKQLISTSHVLFHLITALDDNGNLTSPLGLQIAEFPLPPMFAKMLLVSGKSYNGNLTSPLGLQMAEFPLPPMFARMLLVSGKSNGSYWEKTCLWGS